MLAVALAFVSWIAYRATRPVEPKPLVRLDVDLGTEVTLGSLAGADTIISPDDTRLVYVSEQKLYTRRMDQPKAAELAGTEGAFSPFFSPDGRWVAFFAGNKLKKISVEGGAAIALCDAASARGGSWGEDGDIIAALNVTGGLSRISSTGGAAIPLTELAQGEISHRWPQILPGGRAVLFTSNTRDGADIVVLTLANHRRKVLQGGATFGRYLPSSNGGGHLVYINKGTLFALPVDLDKLEVLGAPSPVLDEVAFSPGNGSAQFAFSRNGTLVFRRGGTVGGELLTVQWLDGAGKMQPLLTKPDAYTFPRLSPDGERLALSTADVWVYQWRRDTMTRLTFDGGQVPVWSPDGRYIAFRKPGDGMFLIRADGAGKPQRLTQSKNLQGPWSFTPDGKRLAYMEQGYGTTLWDLWTVPLESDGAGLRAGKPEVFLQTPANERQPTYSQDGRWIAYSSDESGASQIYVRTFPDQGGKWQISDSDGAYPMWSRNGHELFFETLDNRIMVATYAVKSDSFIADKPRLWSENKLAGAVNIAANVDLAPDGKRIVALMPAPESKESPSHVIFLLNFSDELRRKVPVGK